MNPQQAEQELLQKTGDLINYNLAIEIAAQGHHLTGGLERSIKGSVIIAGSANILTGTMAFYGGILNAGVTADRIPYSDTPTGAKTSKYIEGLKAFWMLKGLSEKEATSAAFATAKKQKKEGMPTAGSYLFSETGQRKRFIQIVDDAISPEVNNMISDGFDTIINEIFHETHSETI